MALISTVPPLTGAVDPLDADLVQGDGTSTYRLAHADKSSGRLAWELWASSVLLMVQVREFTLYDWREWRQQPIKDGSLKTNGAKLAELRMKHPDLAEHIDAALEGEGRAMSGNEPYDICVELIRETAAAWLVTDGTMSGHGLMERPEEVWVPKSQCELDDNGDGTWTLTAPEWLLESKGLI